jgi:trehalose synthase-fused probable maltokinase
MAHEGGVNLATALDRPVLMRLLAQLKTRRWFPFKSDSVVDAHLVDAVPESLRAGGSAIVIVDISTTAGGTTIVITPSFTGSGRDDVTGQYADAVEDGNIYSFMDRFVSDDTVPGASGRIVIHGPFVGEFQSYMKTKPGISALNVEQSNSSFTIGDKYICKVFRRPVSPDNPDFTVPVKLYTETQFRNIPKPVAQLVHEPEPLLSVASIQENVPNSGDYWHYFLELSNSIAGGIADPATGNVDKPVAELSESTAELAETVAEMHGALYGINDPGFGHEAFTSSDIAQIRRRYMDLASAIRRTSISLSIDGRLYDGLDFYDLISSFVDNFDFSPLYRVEKIRVHGDLHLGQVLRTGRGPVIIDFEGEPMRSENERSSLGCVLKDVAGMTRSIDYALSFHSRSDARLATETRKISMKLREVFLQKYFSKSMDLPTVPPDYADFMKTAAYYEIEKAVYEANYEMNNRPDWIIIPARALVETLAGTGSQG